ncbi:SRPBCC domain-containing protein [Acidocella sp.]|uniref:SRPBCC domain-containing protein n=1 Tax=Acidocella sp. TaxID=50710 RepID=UPI00262F19D6|nr:SRPBCC domain-containing protein [Acidocella sp.]MDD2795476.1 SRPBCC domain-containing protein [Acidocella sp.]
MRRGFPLLCLLLCLSACGPADLRQSRLAAQGKTDTSAPLQTTQQISINAPADKIWALLANPQAWPSWNSITPQTSAPSILQPGSLFSYNADGMSIHAAVREFIPSQALAWTGDVLNFHAIQTWTLTPQPGGVTLVSTSESVSGFLIGLFFSQARLESDDRTWLKNLKAAAELP